MNKHFFIYNNKFFPLNTPVINIGNRSLRYGDGLFETMRMQNEKILNVDFHFERFFYGLRVLQFDIPRIFSPEFLTQKINDLLIKNEHHKNARVRMMAFRGDGGIFDVTNSFPNYIIETSQLGKKIELNENGLTVDVFPDAKKSCEQFSNLKSNNYLPYAMAGLFAKKNNLNDAILLNVFERICESAIANIFIINEDKIYTPPLSEGCIAGVMRRWMLEKFSLRNYVVIERNLSIDDILNADEFFLTNSIHPVRWVKIFRGKTYGNKRIKDIFYSIVQNI